MRTTALKKASQQSPSLPGRRNLVTWFVPAMALAVLAIDQITKWWVLQNLPLNTAWAPFQRLERLFVIAHVANPGAAFGLFKDRGLLFIFIAVVVSGAIIVYNRYLPQGQHLLRVSLGLQLGGALGNLVDRVRFGHVIDFIAVGLGGLRWPTFNVADMAIVLGVVLLVAILLNEPAGLTDSPDDAQDSQDGTPCG